MLRNYVIVDLETTGMRADTDKIIEIGAIKVENGQESIYNSFVNPEVSISERIVEIVGITDEMVKGKDNEEEVTKRFLAWTGDLPMVAHNAKFDASFLEMCYVKYGLGEYKNVLIDTLELSRAI